MFKKSYKYVSLFSVLTMLSACASTQVAVSKRNLDVQTKMSASLFMDPVEDESLKTIYIQARNSSDKEDFRIGDELQNQLRSRGFRVVNDLKTANYMLQVNILQVGKADPTAAEAALYKGYGFDGAEAGNKMAYLAGATDKGLVGASLIGGIAAVVSDSLIKDVYYSVITDVQIRERVAGGKKVSVAGRHYNQSGTSGGSVTHYNEQSNWKTYQTRVLSSANKMNLKFDEALPELKKNLAQSIAGIF